MPEEKTQPVNLTHVDVVGSKDLPLNDELLQKLLTPLLGSSDKTLGQLVSEGSETVDNFQYSGLFKSIGLKFNKDESKSMTDILGEDILNVGAELDVKLNKLSNIKLSSINNEFGNSVGLAYDNINMLANGESFKAVALSSNLESVKSQLVDVQFKSPMLNPSLKLVVNGLYQDESSRLFDSNLRTAGLQFGIEKQKFSKKTGFLNTITGGLTYFKRSVTDIKDNANDEIKTYAGDDIKQSFFFNGSVTNMEYLPKSASMIPLNGVNFSFQNELTGLLGNEEADKFFKINLDLELAKSTPCKWFTITSGLHFGQITSLDNEQGSTIHFQDKFYKFIPGSLSPIQPKSSIGGLSYAGYDIGILSKVGLKAAELPLRAYANLQGVLVNPKGFAESTEYLQHGVDVGLLYQNDIATAKVSVRNQLNDTVSPSFGFEVSINGDW